MESRLLEILVCPICKSSLRYDRQHQELICQADRLAFPVRDGVPIMLENEARELGESAPPSSVSGSPPGTPSAPSTSAGTDTQS